MTRLHEAMRQAGKVNDEPASQPGQPDEFVVRESAAEAVTLPERRTRSPRPVAPEVPRPGALVAKHSPPPIASSDSALVHKRDDDVRLTDVLSVLYRKRWLILAVILAFVGAAIIYSYSVTPVFEARARVMIEQSDPQVVTFRPVEAEDLSRVEDYLTQLEILRSRALARQALEKLGLLSKQPDAQRDQVGALAGSLTVSPVNQSRIVELRLRSSDPGYAARAVNAVAEAYVDHNLKNRVEASRDASDWLTKQLAELRQQVDVSEGALQQYREQSDDAISLEDRQSIVAQKLAQLNAAVTAARTRRVENETLYSQLRAIEESGEPLDTFSPIVSNLFIQGLKADLAALQRERAQLAEQLGDLHPDMIRVDTAIASSERRLSTEIAKVVDGIRNDFRAAQANERGLLAALEEQKTEVIALNRDAIGYRVLQRDVTSTQQIFDSLLQRVKEADLAGELQSNNVRILDRAEVPRSPVWPRTQLNLILAFLSACVVGGGLSLGLHYLRPRLATPDEVGDSLGLPVLGVAPKVTGLESGIEGARAKAFPPAFREAFRGIRARILLSPHSTGLRSLVVTSTGSGEGKTIVASNLAISMARAGRRVLLVDADMRASRLHRLFGIPRSPGLSDVLTGLVPASATIYESAIEGLFVLPAGVEPESASDLLETAGLRNLVRTLSEGFDLVVLDTPPVMTVADASIIANAASGVLFVVGAGVNREVAQNAIDRLAAAQASVIGVVLNKAAVDRQSEDYAHYSRDVTESDAAI